MSVLAHEVKNYGAFIVLLASLYIVSGGIRITGDVRGLPTTNAAFLGSGAVLANLIGTTGASVLLIRPVLRINKQRQHTAHLSIFFIFIVSNLGGLLTPLGDPPLFLGFLHGVDFFWTLRLWPHWFVTNGIVLILFLIWDTIAYARENPQAIQRDISAIEPLAIKGKIGLIFLAGIMAAVLLQGLGPASWREPAGAAVMVIMALLSLALTPAGLRRDNGFTWAPIIEVAILFAGIFITMVPALELLSARGQELGVSKPWQFFWITGTLSAFLDNAPTYLTFATLAAGSSDVSKLVANQAPGLDGPQVLAAISCGAVFMGAMTYIGNGPNFMIKAIADAAGWRTPTFFGYLVYSCLILLPVFGAVTWFFFNPF
jgi:Na+/H+ antiporter NhaD/arsenite permease-like protein